MVDVKIKQGSIIEESVEAIVNPANSYGYMGGGVAGVLKKAGGAEIEIEARSKAPIKIGNAVLTTAGNLKANFVMHVPTMKKPAEITTLDNVRKAMIAALRCAEQNKIRSIAIPGMGTGVGNLNKTKAAKVMLDVIKNFKLEFLKEIRLVDVDKELVKEFNKLK